VPESESESESSLELFPVLEFPVLEFSELPVELSELPEFPVEFPVELSELELEVPEFPVPVEEVSSLQPNPVRIKVPKRS